MTEDEATKLRSEVDRAIRATEAAFHLAERADPPAPVGTLRTALMELLGVKLACNMRLEAAAEEKKDAPVRRLHAVLSARPGKRA